MLVEPILDLQSGVLVFGDETGKSLLQARVLGILRLVGPLIGIDLVIIKFFGTGFIPDVWPPFGTEGGISFAVGGDHRGTFRNGLLKPGFD